MASKQDLYKSIAVFFNKEITSAAYPPEIVEGLEVAKQCLESAFHFSVDEVTDVPSLQSIFESNVKQSSQPKVEPNEETKAMAEMLKNQGNLCMKQEKFEEAVACYTKAIELSPFNAVYYCNRAAACSRLDQHENAISDCKKAIEIDPQYSKAYGRMGIAYSSMKNYAKAVESYRKGLELDPNNENCQQNLSIAEERLKNSTDCQSTNPLSDSFVNTFFNNPMMQTMTRQFMNDSNVQNLVANFLVNSVNSNTNPQTETANDSHENVSNAAPTQNGNNGAESFNMDNFLRIGQRLAQELRAVNPELVDTLRQTFADKIAGDNSDSNNNDENKNPE